MNICRYSRNFILHIQQLPLQENMFPEFLFQFFPPWQADFLHIGKIPVRVLFLYRGTETLPHLLNTKIRRGKSHSLCKGLLPPKYPHSPEGLPHACWRLFALYSIQKAFAVPVYMYCLNKMENFYLRRCLQISDKNILGHERPVFHPLSGPLLIPMIGNKFQFTL